MSIDFDFAYTRARFTDFDLVGDRIPGAPAVVASGGITFGAESGWFGALRATRGPDTNSTMEAAAARRA
jgi:hypothetical protein